jgi:hypothetical protein
MVPPINASNYLNQSNGIYSNHVTGNNILSSMNGGITNQAYTRDARWDTLFFCRHLNCREQKVNID